MRWSGGKHEPHRRDLSIGVGVCVLSPKLPTPGVPPKERIMDLIVNNGLWIDVTITNDAKRQIADKHRKYAALAQEVVRLFAAVRVLAVLQLARTLSFLHGFRRRRFLVLPRRLLRGFAWWRDDFPRLVGRGHGERCRVV